MPIPFIFMAIAGATAAVGAGKTIKAAVDIKDAKDTNDGQEFESLYSPHSFSWGIAKR